jgi:hypothetical protein
MEGGNVMLCSSRMVEPVSKVKVGFGKMHRLIYLGLVHLAQQVFAIYFIKTKIKFSNRILFCSDIPIVYRYRTTPHHTTFITTIVIVISATEVRHAAGSGGGADGRGLLRGEASRPALLRARARLVVSVQPSACKAWQQKNEQQSCSH